MWKGSDAHVSPIGLSLAAQALTHNSAFGWPPVTWKGSGAHVPTSSVHAVRAPTRSYSPTTLPTRLRARLVGGNLKNNNNK
ncbi:unnamed protein product [Spirodela intermedia]|uniref:Uncharacterized protein n=1 Tax=Spirodela intermedia TaxID=51605 RepID=A0A7I8K6H9_SPIIN|nr:unnamed protein product [Spirodela intermedia]